MKIEITMKDPDGVSYSIDERLAELGDDLELPLDEQEAVLELWREKIKEALRKWITYGEYLTVEFDLDEGTATVKEDR